MRRLGYALKQAFAQIHRNRNMSIASIFAITAMMIILGIFLVLILNVNLFANNVEEQFDTIEVYLEDDVTDAEGAEITEKIADIPNVATAVYLSKEDAMDEMKERWGENAYLLDGLVDNPFPPTVEITSTDLQYERDIVAALDGMEGIDEVKYYQEVIDRLMKITRYLEYAAVILIGVLILVSIIVVSNTIKLTVHAREDEIHIMKYVGATNWFVRAPFLIEGIVLGFISSVIGAAIVGVCYYKIVEVFSDKVLILFSSGLVPFEFIMENAGIIFVALGVCIGSLGSILSMRRFLDA